MSDGVALLAERLQALSDEGVKTVPATVSASKRRTANGDERAAARSSGGGGGGGGSAVLAGADQRTQLCDSSLPMLELPPLQTGQPIAARPVCVCPDDSAADGGCAQHWLSVMVEVDASGPKISCAVVALTSAAAAAAAAAVVTDANTTAAAANVAAAMPTPRLLMPNATTRRCHLPCCPPPARIAGQQDTVDRAQGNRPACLQLWILFWRWVGG